MSSSSAKVATALRYRDVEKAAKWLQAAFAFEFHARHANDDGSAGMVQLTYGDDLIMLLPVGGSALDGMMRQPDEVGGAETRSSYLVVGDVDAHHRRAHAAGADIVSGIETFDRGGRGYICRDLEGHLWSFGSYDPWSAAPPRAAGTRAARPAGRHLSLPATLAALAGLVILIGGSWAGWHMSTRTAVVDDRVVMDLKAANEKAEAGAARLTAELAKERSAREVLGIDVQKAQDQLTLERSARANAEQSLRQSEAKQAAEARAKTAAQEATGLANEAVARERTAKEAAERAAGAVRKELALANSAKLKAERTTKETAEQLARERAAKEAAESLARDAQEKLKQAQVRPQAGAKPAAGPKQPAATKKAASSSSPPSSAQPMPPLVP
jgi:uncharacterized glyoxalase superfamily protein PhnB